MLRLGFLSLVLLVGSSFSQGNSQNLINSILDQKLVVSDGLDKYRTVLPKITKGTKFENRWQINGPISDQYLNLYILRAGLRGRTDLPGDLGNLLGGCVHLGEKNIVLCDDGFINTFLEKHKVREMLMYYPGEENIAWQRHQEAFIVWVLGHEIGHIVKGHGLAHFGADNLDKEVAASSLDQREELDADSFIVDEIKNDQGLLLELTKMVLNFLNAEIRSKIGKDIPVGVGILFDYTGKKVVSYFARNKHPEYVIRLTRILQQIGKVQNDEGLLNMTNDFARYMRQSY